MSNYHITLESNNKKTGNIIVITSSRDTCPNACPFKGNGCYAELGPLAMHWNKISNGQMGCSFEKLIARLESLPREREEKLLKKLGDAVAVKEIMRKKLPIRLWQAGDLPGENNKINFTQVKKLVNVLQPFTAFGYTHKPLNKENRKAIKYCNDNGVTINLSANNLKHADELFALDIGPVSVVVERAPGKMLFTPGGIKVKVCPATLSDRVHCANCGGNKPLCSRKRDYIIAFPAHGARVKKVEEVACAT
jgi:hypothetical protein